MAKRKRHLAACRKWCRGEFQPGNFSLVHSDHRLFVESQWSRGRVSAPFLCYRLVAALLLVTWCALDLWFEVNRWFKGAPHLWFLFATNWSFVILAASSVVSAVNAVRFYRRQRKQLFQPDIPSPPTGTDCFLSFQWLLHVAGSNLALLVSVAFWAFVFVFEGPAFLKSGMSIAKHTVNSVYVIADLSLIATPVRLLHVVYPATVGLLYCLAYGVYFSSGGLGPVGENHIYEMLDWSRDPTSSSLACLFAFSTMVMSQFILYMVYKIRHGLWERQLGRDEEGRLVNNFSLEEDEEDEEEEDGAGGGDEKWEDRNGEEDAARESDAPVRKMPANYHAIN